MNEKTRRNKETTIEQHQTYLMVHQIKRKTGIMPVLKKGLNIRVHWTRICASNTTSDATSDRALTEACNVYVEVYNILDMLGGIPDSTTDIILKEVADTNESFYLQQTCPV